MAASGGRAHNPRTRLDCVVGYNAQSCAPGEGEPLHAESPFDLAEMISSMMGAIQADSLSNSFDIGGHLRAEPFDALVNVLSARDCQFCRRTRWDRQAVQPRDLIDDVCVYRRRAYALFFPFLDQNERPLVPKGQVRQDGRDGPACFQWMSQFFVGQPIRERPEVFTLGCIF